MTPKPPKQPGKDKMKARKCIMCHGTGTSPGVHDVAEFYRDDEIPPGYSVLDEPGTQAHAEFSIYGVRIEAEPEAKPTWLPCLTLAGAVVAAIGLLGGSIWRASFWLAMMFWAGALMPRGGK